jgi:hypothetical protein
LTNDLAKLDETLRTLDDLNEEIDKVKRYLEFEPDNVFEQDCYDSYGNKLGRLLTLRHTFEKLKTRYESS